MIAPEIGWALVVYALMGGEHVGIRVIDQYASNQRCQEAGERLPPSATWGCVVGNWRTEAEKKAAR